MYPSIIIVPNVPLWWSCRYNFDHVISVFRFAGEISIAQVSLHSNMTQNSHYKYHSIITHQFTDDAAVES